MFRCLALAAGLAVFIPTAVAQEAIAPETVAAVKNATVFIRVEGDGWVSTGSGFVVSGDATKLLIATNHHVALPSPSVGGRAGAKPATITVVFDSGTKTERSYTATVAGFDVDRDLAVLKVAGVKDIPKPIPYADPPKLVETMQVYSFGFPFGKALSTNKGFPAVTVGKASISSLRNDSDGELSIVQIDGNLNPGNSGGPIVDVKGQLVGVAVATIRDGQGIGLSVPAHQLGKMMQGRVGGLRVNSLKKADGTVTVRLHAEVIDPTGRLLPPAAYYVVVPPNTKRPEVASLESHAQSKRVELKIVGTLGTAEFTLPAAEGEVLVQVVASATTKPAATLVQPFSLVPPPSVVDLSRSPPTGWQTYSPRDRSFAMWVPAKPSRQSDEVRTITIDGKRLAISAMDGKTVSGLLYEGESITLPPILAKLPAREVAEFFSSGIVSALGGRVVETKPVEAGELVGDEFVIQSGPVSARMRVFVSGSRAYVVQVIGTTENVARKDADILLASFHLPKPAVKLPNETATRPSIDPTIGKKDVATLPRGKEPTIVAGGNNPLFKDVAPDGGMLIGLELGMGKFGKEDVIKAVRPIYRVGDKEVLGTQKGTQLSRVTTIKAKDGYAVGAITYKFGLNFDGCSLTFMKVVDGKLDPKDSYESEWAGYIGRKTPSRITGDGTPAVGIAGRGSDREVNGLGLLFKGQERSDLIPSQPVGKEPQFLGGYTNNPFKDVAPEGGLLVGFEFGLNKFFGRDMIRTVRPIFREGDKETLGEQHGTALKNTVTVKAKPGYAVGQILAKHGGAFDGCSVVFMKVTADGKLDKDDAYESEWVGTDENKTPTKLGNGTPVLGVVGRVNDKELVSMGLLFKGQEKYEPMKR